MTAGPESNGSGDMWSSLLHAGLAGTFMGLPHVPPDQSQMREAGTKAAIYGIPWDSTSISRTGANYGPRGMREVSCQTLSYNATMDFDLTGSLKMVDCGDANVVLANAERTFEAAQADIGEIVRAEAVPAVLGGDHSVTIPAARAVATEFENPGFVLIDSHLDTAPDVGGETLNHCSPVPRALEAGFPPENMVLIGMGGWLNPRAELEYCRQQGIEVIWIEELWNRGTSPAIERALEIAGRGTDGIYLSFDIDALDAAYAPGTCVPTPGGLTARETIELVRGIAAEGLIGLDVVEVAPSLDATSRTAGLGCRVLVEALAAHAGARLPENLQETSLAASGPGGLAGH